MLNLAGLVDDSIVDGPGIRLTVFCQGCSHHCEGCHNPDTWEFCGGTEMEEQQIVQMAKANPLVKGVTFSGGEPFDQAAGFAKLAKLLKKEGYEVASYSGYTFEQLVNGTKEQKDLLQNIDVLIDGPFILGLRNLSLIYRGSSNQRILDAKESLLQGEAIEKKSPRWFGEY
ncbi:anaerobic ribonucleoside-triphosphate reductase activating protein [[Clostridium] fimetarium]|uniref:Anaerobic ribonucleoside-triphosphate reductase-activating protein n=1 Tax=[Clostridium] fimetarium TaxID=99656 RepID=A0A1I0M8K9_9FIRM|nr:anaerobic ribonucleoside-triphosphate reductase activating protein [[Clostridium] fimetarium]SEV84090.1 anaerobic ribonucleoside-triphosphate reductase activating protein [[Clostridium] fimetarium]